MFFPIGCYVCLLPWWMPCHFLVMAAEEFSRLKKNGKGPDDFPSLTSFAALRKNEDTFTWFAFKFLECVAGVNAWKRRKMKVTVSAFDPTTKCPYVSISDEAFALLLLDNYLVKWKYRWQCEQDNKQYKRQPGRYTSSNAGHVEFGGWTNEGIMRFNELVEIVRTDREGQHAPNVEQKLLQKLRDSRDGNRAQRLERQQQRRQQDILMATVRPYDELHYLQANSVQHDIVNATNMNGDCSATNAHLTMHQQDDVVNRNSV